MAVYVKFPIVTGALKDKASIAIWTTTPWTLPANLAIAVAPKEIYVGARVREGGRSEMLVAGRHRSWRSFAQRPGWNAVGEPIADISRAQD